MPPPHLLQQNIGEKRLLVPSTKAIPHKAKKIVLK